MMLYCLNNAYLLKLFDDLLFFLLPPPRGPLKEVRRQERDINIERVYWPSGQPGPKERREKRLQGGEGPRGRWEAPEDLTDPERGVGPEGPYPFQGRRAQGPYPPFQGRRAQGP
jgi:hypothetical protein